MHVYAISCFQARKYIESLPYMPQQDLKVVFRGANPLGKYLIFRYLPFNTETGYKNCIGYRQTLNELVLHCYFIYKPKALYHFNYIDFCEVEYDALDIFEKK